MGKKSMKPKKGVEREMDVIGTEFSRVPPQAVDLEEVVLGALMLEKDAILSIIDILKPECFYRHEHQLIYNAILSLSNKNEPIDILTVTNELRLQETLEEVGGEYYLSTLLERVVSSAHIETHARIILQKYIQRELIRVSTEIQEQAFDESLDVADLLDFAEGELFKIAEGSIKREVSSIKPILKKALNQIEAAGKRKERFIGVPSGFTELDRITSGWQNSDLIVVAARPSMGKTAFMLSMVRYIAIEARKAVGIFSLEMSSLQLVTRLIVSETELAIEKIKRGDLKDYEWHQLETKIKDLDEALIFIDDTPAISIFELRAKCRRLKQRHNVEIIMIDYLQLMTTGKAEKQMTREQEVSTISRSLKALAKELDLPIIALSQLNRAVDMRSGEKRPQLSDLRESGAIEQDADLVVFLHRPEYYGLTTDSDGNPTEGKTNVIVAKHRNGITGEITLKFLKAYAKFCDINDPRYSDLEDQKNRVIIESKMNYETELEEIDSQNDVAQETPF